MPKGFSIEYLIRLFRKKIRQKNVYKTVELGTLKDTRAHLIKTHCGQESVKRSTLPLRKIYFMEEDIRTARNKIFDKREKALKETNKFPAKMTKEEQFNYLKWAIQLTTGNFQLALIDGNYSQARAALREMENLSRKRYEVGKELKRKK